MGLEKMGQGWKKWDNVGKNGTTFMSRNSVGKNGTSFYSSNFVLYPQVNCSFFLFIEYAVKFSLIIDLDLRTLEKG